MAEDKRIYNGGDLHVAPHRDMHFRDDLAAGIVAGADPDHDRMFETKAEAANYGLKLRVAEIQRLNREVANIKLWAKYSSE